MNEMANTEASESAEMERLVKAASEALTDSMVERLTDSAGNGLEILDRLNDEDTKEAVHSLLDGLTEMHRTGALQTVMDSVMTLHAMRNAMTDNMVDRLFAFIEHMANTLATEEIATLAHETKGALEDALDTCSIKGKPAGGLFSTLAMVNSTEAQESLQFLLSFGCKLRQRASVLQRMDAENP